MATLSIKNVPEDVVEGLRHRAARNHRSMQGELMALVREAVASGAHAAGAPAATSDSATGSKTIEEIAAAHQARWKEPFVKAPLATEIIRRDRDAH